MTADGRVLTEAGFVLHASLSRDPASSVSFSSASLLSNLVLHLLPTGGRDSVKVAGCLFPDDIDDAGGVHDHQKKKVGHLRRLPPDIIRACARHFRSFPNGKINIFA